MRRLARRLLLAAVAAFTLSVSLFAAGIWTTGELASRLGETGALLGAIGFFVFLAGLACLEAQ